MSGYYKQNESLEMVDQGTSDSCKDVDTNDEADNRQRTSNYCKPRQ